MEQFTTHSRNDNIESKKKTIVVHLNGAFTPMTNRELWYLRSHETEKRYTNL